MSYANTAKKCFVENIRLFAHAQTEPEKYNLYNGLTALADAIAQIQAQLGDLDHRLGRLELQPRPTSAPAAPESSLVRPSFNKGT